MSTKSENNRGAAANGKTILILTGNGTPARAAANIYASAFPAAGHDVHFIENTIGLKRIITFFWKRLKRFGIMNTAGVFWLRLRGPGPASIEKNYIPDMFVSNLDDINEIYLRRLRPDVVIANACSLLSADLISTLTEMGCVILNVPNGINPRYRGTGNGWAFFEGNFEMAGATLHHVDAGIDTGQTICAQKIDFVKLKTAYVETDCLALEIGARMAVEYVCTGAVVGPCMKVSPEKVRSRVYTFPTWTEYKLSKKRFEYAAIEKVQVTAQNSSRSDMQLMQVRTLTADYAPAGSVLDVTSIGDLREQQTASVQTILAIGTLDQTYNTGALIDEMLRALAPNGTLIVSAQRSAAELLLLFAPQATVEMVQYGGVMGSRFLSREITVVFKKKPQ